MTEPETRRFPYMFWAHTEAFRSPYCLSQSGMPMPDPHVLGEISGEGLLAHPCIYAQPEAERRLAELFDVPPERVMVTVGASGAMNLVAQQFFRPGSRVVADVPSYEPFRALPELYGAELCIYQRQLETGWQIDPAEVERTLQGASGPGHIFITNPNNPTWAVLDASAVTELAAVAGRAGGLLVCCEVYMEYGTNEQRVHAARLAPNAISIGSFTKAYGLGALRVGWMILGEDVAARREEIMDISYLSYVDPPTASLSAALVALDKLPDLLQPLRQVECHSRPHLDSWLSGTEGIEAHTPPFGIIAFPRVAAVTDTLALAEHLVEEFGVDVVPGEYFGMPGHIRVGCGMPEATLVEGLVRLSNGIRSWRERATSPS